MSFEEIENLKVSDIEELYEEYLSDAFCALISYYTGEYLEKRCNITKDNMPWCEYEYTNCPSLNAGDGCTLYLTRTYISGCQGGLTYSIQGTVIR